MLLICSYQTLFQILVHQHRCSQFFLKTWVFKSRLGSSETGQYLWCVLSIVSMAMTTLIKHITTWEVKLGTMKTCGFHIRPPKMPKSINDSSCHFRADNAMKRSPDLCRHYHLRRWPMFDQQELLFLWCFLHSQADKPFSGGSVYKNGSFFEPITINFWTLKLSVPRSHLVITSYSV